MEQVLASVIIITRNRADSLARSLDALAKQDYKHHEVIVVDNASTDHTPDVVRMYKAQYVTSPAQAGFAKTRQIGVQKAKGELILFCDDDCVPASHWISCYMEAFHDNPNLALAAGKVINVNFSETLKHKGTEIFTRNGYIARVADPAEALLFANLNMAVSALHMNQVGGYDPFFKGGYEEIDLNLMFRQHGWHIEYLEDALVQHYHHSISFKKGRWLYGAQWVRLYLVFKHINLPYIQFSIPFEGRKLITESWKALKLVASGIKRRDQQRLAVGCIECFNAISARIAIPYLWWIARKWRKRFKKISRANCSYQ